MSLGLFGFILSTLTNLITIFVVIANVNLTYSLFFSPFCVSPVNVLDVELCDFGIDIFWFYKMVAGT